MKDKASTFDAVRSEDLELLENDPEAFFAKTPPPFRAGGDRESTDTAH